MIPQGIKEKIFALYWGQNVICNDDYVWRSKETFDTVLSVYNGDLSKWYALLKPLASITGIDAIKVAKILIDKNITQFDKRYFDSNRLCETFKFGKFYLQFDTIGDMDYRITSDKEASVTLSYQLISESLDYLRSHGYALPAYGYSVENLVKEGVFKLIEK